VGLSRKRTVHLTTPWSGRWRVDVVGMVKASGQMWPWLIEVKGTSADLRREDMTMGKWQLDYSGHGIWPWVSVARGMDFSQVPGSWGILTTSLDGLETRITRRPETPEGQPNLLQCYLALASVQTTYNLPSMYGRHSRRYVVEKLGEYARPLRFWDAIKDVYS